MTRPPALVIDSTFLWDLYGIPRGRTGVDEGRRQLEKQRLQVVLEQGCALFVPFPVIFETANSVAKIRSSTEREATARRLVSDVESSVERAAPWTVTPADGWTFDEQALLALCRGFGEEIAAAKIGLVDLFVAQEAARLKRRLGAQRLVHIWTNDQLLKGREPDPEVADWWLPTAVAGD